MSVWHARAAALAGRPGCLAVQAFDPLGVPAAVRGRLAAALPPREFLLFQGDQRSGLLCAVTNTGSRPYHICIPRWTPHWDRRVAVVAAMAAGREAAYAALSSEVAGANPGSGELPIMREYWEETAVGVGKLQRTLIAYDMLFPASAVHDTGNTYAGPSILVNTFTFSTGDMSTPTRCTLHSRVNMF